MPLARAAIPVRPKPSITLYAPRRRYSDDRHHSEHHGEQDIIEYPKETIGSSFWRNSFLLALLTVGFYKFAPAPGDDVYLTRWIAFYTTPAEEWVKRNAQHLLLTKANSETELLFSSAQKPPVHRYRYPQAFDQYSPHLAAVGSTPDFSNLVVKGDKE